MKKITIYQLFYEKKFLVSRQFKQFVDIITMNAVHHTNFERAYVLDVHFSKSTIESDVTVTSAKRQRFNKCVVHSWAAVHSEIEIMSTKSFNKDNQYLDFSLKHARTYTHTCLMVLHTSVQQSHGSHFAVVDSGTSMYILQYHLFTSNLSEDHTAVSRFSGNTSRATHRGDFNCVVRAQNGRLIHLVDPSAVLVIPDSHRNLWLLGPTTAPHMYSKFIDASNV